MKRSNRQAAEFVIDKLTEQGFTALLAGGCVRDLLLDRAPKDHDIATDATPDEVANIFRKSDKVGAKFGVVLVRLMGQQIEVATFRTDGSYSDGRHPDAVTFGSLEDDAERRDFTINGMYFDTRDNRVIDLVGGQADLDARLVRAIGDPDRRFAEDHLRLLRAVRFAARLGFTIESNTAAAITHHAGELARISVERVREELRTVLTEPTRAVGWSMIRSLGLADHLIPGVTWNDQQATDIAKRLTALAADADFMMVMTILLRHLEPKQADAACRRFTCSNAEARAATWLITQLPRVHRFNELELADIKEWLASEHDRRLFALHRTDLLATDQPTDPHDKLMDTCRSIPTEDIAPPPLLTGDDLLTRGVPQGPQYARILRTLYRAQRNNEISTKSDAEKLLRELLE